uniref:Uncharacterized protein n=1 Tax=Lepeophtheirus salmonis TaxID=72036 RepID=A0A0K2U1C1_LEPSM
MFTHSILNIKSTLIHSSQSKYNVHNVLLQWTIYL